MPNPFQLATLTESELNQLTRELSEAIRRVKADTDNFHPEAFDEYADIDARYMKLVHAQLQAVNPAPSSGLSAAAVRSSEQHIIPPSNAGAPYTAATAPVPTSRPTPTAPATGVTTSESSPRNGGGSPLAASSTPMAPITTAPSVSAPPPPIASAAPASATVMGASERPAEKKNPPFQAMERPSNLRTSRAAEPARDAVRAYSRPSSSAAVSISQHVVYDVGIPTQPVLRLQYTPTRGKYAGQPRTITNRQANSRLSSYLDKANKLKRKKGTWANVERWYDNCKATGGVYESNEKLYRLLKPA